MKPRRIWRKGCKSHVICTDREKYYTSACTAFESKYKDFGWEEISNGEPTCNRCQHEINEFGLSRLREAHGGKK